MHKLQEKDREKTRLFGNISPLNNFVVNSQIAL